MKWHLSQLCFIIIIARYIETTSSQHLPFFNPYSIPYSIPYSKTDFPGVSSPECGREIDQMDVSSIPYPNQIRLSYTTDPTEVALMWTTNGISHHEIVMILLHFCTFVIQCIIQYNYMVPPFYVIGLNHVIFCCLIVTILFSV